jgi:hypothetical protein
MQDSWEIFDLISLVCIFAWILSLRYYDNVNSVIFGRGFLALAAIPLSFSLLQYLSIFQSLGQLVIIIQALVWDLVSFAIVFLVCILGFGIALRGIFHLNEAFISTGVTFLTLYSAAMGTFDFTIFDGENSFQTFGTVLFAVYVIMTAVVLINLLIAKMSSTYQRIYDKSLEEWTLLQAKTLQKFILLEENSPLCMLPPPFNGFSTSVYVVVELMKRLIIWSRKVAKQMRSCSEERIEDEYQEPDPTFSNVNAQQIAGFASDYLMR